MLRHKFAECRCADPSSCRSYLRDSAAGPRQLQCCSRTQHALSRSGLHSQASGRCTRASPGSSSAVEWHHAHTLLTPWKASQEAPAHTVGSRCPLLSFLPIVALAATSHHAEQTCQQTASNRPTIHIRTNPLHNRLVAAEVQMARLGYADGSHMQGCCHAYGMHMGCHDMSCQGSGVGCACTWQR